MKKRNLICALIALLLCLSVSKTAFAESGDFVLFKQLSEIHGIDLIILISAAVITIALIATVAFVFAKSKTDKEIPKQKTMNHTRALVFGALCLSLSFVLSYIKLFEMPYGGAITLCSMLPIVLYASWFGPLYGFSAAFCYGILQFIQEPYFLSFPQFLFDYVFAFTSLGIASFFKGKRLFPIGILAAGFARMMFSVFSGVIFFAEYAGGMNVWAYSFIYNAYSLGTDALICFVIYLLPPVSHAFNKIKESITM